MQVLPALAEHDFDAFGAGITAIQEAVGDYFAPYQGGRYSSPRVGEVLRWLQDEGLRGVGKAPGARPDSRSSTALFARRAYGNGPPSNGERP